MKLLISLLNSKISKKPLQFNHQPNSNKTLTSNITSFLVPCSKVNTSTLPNKKNNKMFSNNSNNSKTKKDNSKFLLNIT